MCINILYKVYCLICPALCWRAHIFLFTCDVFLTLSSLIVCHQLKGYFGFSEVGLYEVFIHSQCLTYSRWRSARSQFREPAEVHSTEAKLCTAVDGVSSKMYFGHLKKGPPTKINITLSVCYI